MKLTAHGYVNLVVTKDRWGKHKLKIASITDSPSEARGVVASVRLEVALPYQEKIPVIVVPVEVQEVSLQASQIEVMVGDERS